jgi:hypothetical protein
MYAAPASAAGWHDYELEIAPGFAVVRINSLQVCLEGPERALLVCPPYDRPTFGPLVGYAVTEASIITRHLGFKPHEDNPSMWEGDPAKEFFFVVRRDNQHITGPLTRLEWEEAGLPALSSIEWVEPRNPNFWRPLLGDLFFLGFAAVYFGWPLLLLAAAALLAVWLIRRRRKGAAA